MNEQKIAPTIAKPIFAQIVKGVLQRACACGQHTSSSGGECEECKKKRLGTLGCSAVANSPIHEVPPIVHDVLRSPGQELDPGTRSFMEPRFGNDFDRVRVDTDAKASHSARAVNALAYTVGQDVVFGDGQYATTRLSGQRLLAHELTHVVQQSTTQPNLQESLSLNDAQDASETEAEIVASMITAPGNELGNSSAIHSPTPLTVSRSPSVRQQSSLVQRAINTRCFGPSVILNPQAAAGLGLIAEKFVQFDYCTIMGCPAGEQFFDNAIAGPIDPFYIAFTVRKTPSLPAWAIVALSTLSLERPDILAHTALRQDFYEVKPDSVAGRAAGRLKVAAINGYMSFLGLPYTAGSAYTPTALIPIFITSVRGTPMEVYRGLRRARNGLIVYEICVSTDWAKVALAAAIAIIIIIILIILSRGRIPVPGPTLVPIPAMAASQTVREGTSELEAGAQGPARIEEEGLIG